VGERCSGRGERKEGLVRAAYLARRPGTRNLSRSGGVRVLLKNNGRLCPAHGALAGLRNGRRRGALALSLALAYQKKMQR